MSQPVRYVTGDIAPGGGSRPRTIEVSAIQLSGSSARNPAWLIAKSISEALDPRRAPGKLRTLAQMSPEERDAMQALYGSGPPPRKR